MEDVVAGLRGLGWTKEAAKTRVARAHARLLERTEEPIDVETLLRAAVRGSVSSRTG